MSNNKHLFQITLGVLVCLAYCTTLQGAELQATAMPSSNRTYTFGINLALDSTAAGSYYNGQAETLIGLEVWRDWWNALPVNQRTTKWGEVVDVALHVATWSGYAPGFTTEVLAAQCESYYNMTLSGTIDYYFVPVDVWGVNVRQYMYNQGVQLMVGSTDSSEGYYAIPGSFGTPTANILTMTPWLTYLRVAKAKTLAVLRVNDWVYQSEMCQGLIDQAADNDLSVVYSQDMPFNWGTQGAIEGYPASVTAWTQALDAIIKLNPDAIAICDYTFGAKFALQYFRQQKWTPKSMTVSPLYQQFEDTSLLPYVVTTAPYSPSAKYRKQVSFTDSLGFDSLIHARYGREATSTMAQATLAGMLYTAALMTASTNSTIDVTNAMRVTQLHSFMGVTVMDGNDRQTLQSLITQFDSNSQVMVVGPATAAVDEFIYPMPNWDERVFRPKWGSPVEIAGTVIICVGAAIVVGWSIFLVLYWNDKVIVAASPLFCVFILVGCLMVCLSLFTWMPGTISTTVCILRPWLLPVGFMLMFGSLLAKTYRIHKIFTVETLDTSGINNTQVLLWVAVIVGVKIGLSIIMVSAARLTAVIHAVDSLRPSHSYYVCTFPLAAKIVFGFDVAYAVGLLGWGSYLAYKVRKVKRSQYDESKVIAFTIYNVFFFAVIVVVVQFAIGNSYRNLTFMLTTVCSVLGACVTICCLFGSKVYAIRRRDYKSSRSNSHSRETSTGWSRSKPTTKHLSSNSSADEITHLARIIKAREEELEELKKQLGKQSV